MTGQRKEQTIKIALTAWISVSAVLVLSALAVGFIKGGGAFSILIADSPYSELWLTLTSTFIVWMLAGLLIFLLRFDVIQKQNALLWGGFFFIALIYVNLLRERTRYGDIGYYLDAALALHRGEALPTTYIYPLFWVSVLELFAPLGEQGVFIFAWALNVIALFGFYFLIVRTLELYEFSANLAALIATIFILLNTPLLRTMFYGQVNLIVLDGMLLGLVFYRRAPFLSALAMTLAVQIKISPIILIFAILLERNWRWLAWFILTMIIVGALPVLAHGFQPYRDILYNLNLMNARTSFLFRDTSFDSFIFTTLGFIKIDYALSRLLVYASKLIFGLLAVQVVFANIRALSFFGKDEAGKYFFNSAPALMLLLTMLSPIVWEHHGVFLAISFLVLIKTISSEIEWMIFAFAYFLEFVIPSFDFYPWSYVRLLAPLLILWLLWKASKGSGNLNKFAALNHWANSLTAV